MILSLAGEGPLGKALHGKLAKKGHELRFAAPSDDDLFGKAFGCRTIVYLPATSLLEGRLRPSPSTARMRAVLGATNAPGVELLVVAAPPGYEEEVLALQKYGCPYVVLRTPPLIEEVAADPALRERGAVWLPRGRSAMVANASTVAEEIARVMGDDSVQGATLDAPAQTMDAAEVLRQAAALGSGASVHTVSPSVDTMIRHIGRLFRVPEPPIVSLHERLASASA